MLYLLNNAKISIVNIGNIIYLLKIIILNQSSFNTLENLGLYGLKFKPNDIIPTFRKRNDNNGNIFKITGSNVDRMSKYLNIINIISVYNNGKVKINFILNALLLELL